MPVLSMVKGGFNRSSKPFNNIIIGILWWNIGHTFMVPLRNALIVKEHYTLPYPEGTACAEVLLAGEVIILVQILYLPALVFQPLLSLLLTV